MISDEELNGIINSDFRHSALLVELAKELLAHRKAREGWQLVPMEPTDEMITVALAVGAINARSSYAAMLAVSPEPE